MNVCAKTVYCEPSDMGCKSEDSLFDCMCSVIPIFFCSPMCSSRHQIVSPLLKTYTYICCFPIRPYRNNILLDASLTPRLADFGFLLTLILEDKSSCLVTLTGSIALAGTHGYLSPEFIAGKVGPKTDVYSYGIVQYVFYIHLFAWRLIRG